MASTSVFVRLTLRVGLYTLVAWTIVLLIRFELTSLSGVTLVFVRSIILGVIFSVLFRLFFSRSTSARSFDVSLISVSWSMFFTLVERAFFSSSILLPFSYIGWIIPLFVIASIVYAMGKYAR
jgi:hypothetical protein